MMRDIKTAKPEPNKSMAISAVVVHSTSVMAELSLIHQSEVLCCT